MKTKSALRAITAGAIAIVATVLLFGCATPVETVSLAIDDPSAFSQVPIVVGGTAEGRLRLPFTDFTLYYLNDGDARVPVFSVLQRSTGDELVVGVTVHAFDIENAEARVNADARDAIENRLIAAGVTEDAERGRFVNEAMRLMRIFLIGNEGDFFLIEL